MLRDLNRPIDFPKLDLFSSLSHDFIVNEDYEQVSEKIGIGTK
jgi:hypothetical protein